MIRLSRAHALTAPSAVLFALCAACGSSTEGAHPGDASALDGPSSTQDGGDDAASLPGDGSSGDETDASEGADGHGDAHRGDGSGGDAGSGEGGLAADRFVTGVVSFTPGPCAGFGASGMPGVVEGPPVGGGASKGSVDVVALGAGGEIVLSFAPNAIVDGPGADFIVFENPFYIGGNAQQPYAEVGEVSVSDDGATWVTYPCTATSYPYGPCAGWHAVYSAPGNGISPVDPTTAGGDPYDLADVGLTHARFVRIRDKSGQVCPDAGGGNADGFDLDAISIVNAEMP